MKMGITLLIAGVLLAVAGVVLICCDKKPEQNQQVTSTVQTETEIQAVSEAPQKAPEPEMSNKEKGNDFESYIADVLASNGITIKEWNQGAVSSGGNMADNALNPDFFVSQQSEPRDLEYWVEAKWRSSCEDFFSLKSAQFERYKETQRSSKRKIIVAIGVGGSPSAPKSVYFVPLDSIQDGKISREEMGHFYLSNPGRDFRNRMNRWFKNEVFKGKK